MQSGDKIIFNWDKKPFICFQCNFTSKDRSSIFKHLKIHKDPKPYVCQYPECGLKATQANTILVHVKSVHLQLKDILCKICGSAFSTRGNLKDHIRGHTEERPFNCLECKAAFKVKKELQRHVQVVHRTEKPFTCEFPNCDFRAKIKPYLKRHVQVVHRANENQCNKCSYTSGNVQAFRRHLLVHCEDRPYKCSFCDYASRYSDHLKVHMRTHTNERLFACPQCPYKGTTSKLLKSHAASHDESLLLHCPEEACDFKTQWESALKLHTKRKHLMVKPFKCHFCNYESVCDTQLRLHLARVHTGERPFKCVICKYTAVRQSELNCHIVMSHTKKQTEQKGKKCYVCRKTFMTKAENRAHFIVHVDVKPFACPLCKHRSKMLVDLKRHILNMHTRETPYKCEVCSKGFRQKHSLNSHAKEKPYACEFCSFRTKRYCDLSKHVTTHTLERNFKCLQCHAEFSLNSSLKTHAQKCLNILVEQKPKLIQCEVGQCKFKCRIPSVLCRHTKTVHLRVKPFNCSFCEFRCKSKGELMSHVGTHVEEKPFKCEFCDFSTRSKSYLVQHLSTHSNKCDSKQHQCKVCEKYYKTKSYLRQHAIVHRTEKPHICPLCSFRTKYKLCFENHKKIHAERRFYNCRGCGMEFKYKKNFQKHTCPSTPHKVSVTQETEILGLKPCFVLPKDILL